MKTKKRILAYLITLTLAMTSLPVQLFAQDTINTPLPMTALVDTQTTTSGAIKIKPTKYVGDGYEVEFNVTNQWPGAFIGEFVLTNTSDKPLENWILKFNFEHEITNMWNAQIVTHEANSYIIKNMGYNQDIAVGSSLNIGFQANFDDQIKVPEQYDLLIAKQEVEDTDYTIDFKVTSDWGQAFNGEISITNNTEETIEDWTLEFDFDRNIERFWTAEIVEHEGEHYVIKNAGYNANIASGQTITLGLSGTQGNVKTVPQNYKLNKIGISGDSRKEVEYDGTNNFSYVKPFNKEDIVTTSINIDGEDVKKVYVKNQIILSANKGVSFEEIKQLLEKYDGVIVGYIARARRYQVEFTESTYEALCEKIELIKDQDIVKENTVLLNTVKIASQQSITTSNYVPKDPWNGKVSWDESSPNGVEWGIEAIKALSAWQYKDQMEPVNVGVIDLQFDDHEDIGFIEIIDKDLISSEGVYIPHGMEVAGILGARHNSQGISGVAPNAKVYGIITTSYYSGIYISERISDLLDRDVRVINYSMGYDYGKEATTDISKKNEKENVDGQLTEDLLAFLEDEDFLIVCSAGNDGKNIEECDYNSEFTMIDNEELVKRIIVIGSIDNTDNDTYKVSDNSQRGNRIDVMAPGGNLYTTSLNDGYRNVGLDSNNNSEGATSYAAPHVAGVASMVWGIDGNLSAEQVKEYIVSTADREVIKNGKSYRILNALKAVEKGMKVSKTGIAKGTVKDASNLAGIKDAKVLVDNKKTYTTNTDGEFLIDIEADIPHELTISKNGYIDVNYYDVQVREGEEIHLATIMQLPDTYKNVQGKVIGKVVNALNGRGVSGATINIRKDVNNKVNGEIVKTLTTGADGTFSIDKLTNGVYTGEIVSNNMVTTFFNFVCIGENSNIGNIAITPILSDDEMRIILTWGESPRDLDSHLTGKEVHVYYGAKSNTGVNLDYDYTNSYGPETITIDLNKIPAGTYSYYVHWYAGVGTWSTSGEKVQIYIGNKLENEFYIPNSLTGNSGIWNVFNIDTSTRKIIIS